MIRSRILLLALAASLPTIALADGGDREPAGGAFKSSIPQANRPDTTPRSATAPADEAKRPGEEVTTGSTPRPQPVPERR